MQLCISEFHIQGNLGNFNINEKTSIHLNWFRRTKTPDFESCRLKLSAARYGNSYRQFLFFTQLIEKISMRLKEIVKPVKVWYIKKNQCQRCQRRSRVFHPNKNRHIGHITCLSLGVKLAGVRVNGRTTSPAIFQTCSQPCFEFSEEKSSKNATGKNC